MRISALPHRLLRLHAELLLHVVFILLILLAEGASRKLLPLCLFDLNLLLEFHLPLEIAIAFQGLEFFLDLGE